MTINATKIKTKKHETIMYSEGYIIIDSSYMIRADLVELDDTLLQSKIEKNEEFNYNTGKLLKKSKGFYEGVPRAKQLIDPFSEEWQKLENTNLKLMQIKTLSDLFYNQNVGYVAINSDYVKELEGAYDIFYNHWYARTPNSMVACFDTNHEFLMGVMPITFDRNQARKYLNYMS